MGERERHIETKRAVEEEGEKDMEEEQEREW